MRKINKILIIASLSAFAVSLGAGITFAATYRAPVEQNTIDFAGINSNSDNNFQDISYYFGGGTGEDTDHPYLINNSQQLRNLAKLQNLGLIPGSTYFALGTSFQFEGEAMEPIGTSDYPFVGVFNGENHSISFLKVSTNQYTCVGMFGVIGSTTATGTVRQLLLIGPSVSYTGSSAVTIGLVAGKNSQEPGQSSVVQEIEIYGGYYDAGWGDRVSSVHAHIRTGSGAVTCGNGLVGSGPVNNNTAGHLAAGFIHSLDKNRTKYSSASTYAGVTASSTNYYIYKNTENGTVGAYTTGVS